VSKRPTFRRQLSPSALHKELSADMPYLQAYCHQRRHLKIHLTDDPILVRRSLQSSNANPRGLIIMSAQRSDDLRLAAEDARRDSNVSMSRLNPLRIATPDFRISTARPLHEIDWRRQAARVITGRPHLPPSESLFMIQSARCWLLKFNFCLIFDRVSVGDDRWPFPALTNGFYISVPVGR
jgi:hypothetical protein